MKVVLILLLVVPWWAIGQQRTALLYRFTARDMMPAACMPGSSFPSVIDQFWIPTVSPNPGVKNNPRRILNSTFCPIRLDIIDGKYSGHPDFEAELRMAGASCSGGQCLGGCSMTLTRLLADPTLPNFTLPVYGGQPCTRVSGSDLHNTRIVENNMVFHEDGIPKPLYCQTKFRPTNSSDKRCGWDNTGNMVSTTGEYMFNQWFRDNAIFSKRVGFTLNLTLVAGTNNSFQYDSNNDNAGFTDPKFVPLEQFPNCLATNDRLDCSNGGKLWPRALLDANNLLQVDDSENMALIENGGNIYREFGAHTNVGGVGMGFMYSWTLEHHSFFQYQGTEVFEFKGNNDVFVYINEKLIMDLGGVHPTVVSKIDLRNDYVRTSLGLVPGGFYAFDIFYAERHTLGGDLKITTSLAPGCNIIDAGRVAYSFNATSATQDLKLVGGPTWGRMVGGAIQLTNANELNTAVYAFMRQQVNVGAGFTIQFSFKASQGGEGFVFVLQRSGLDDLNGGTGGNLAFKNLPRSIGVAFDFCLDRDRNLPLAPACAERDVRLHYNLNSPESPNSVTSPSTKKLRATLIHPNELNDGAVHRVLVRYFAKSPPWLEVLIDDDLFLQKRGIDIEQIIGGREAWVGFTASTGQFAQSSSDIFITDMRVETIAIEDTNTQSQNIAPVSKVADGRAKVSFLIKTFDFCKNPIQFGGSANRARGILVDETNPQRRLASAIDANVRDLQNGSYSFDFSTTEPGNYSLRIWFGLGCQYNETTPTPNCFTEFHPHVAEFFEATRAPTESPVAQEQGVGEASLIGVGVSAGVVSGFGLVLIAIGARYRRQWRAEKGFIEAGRLAAAERGVQYEGDGDLDMLTRKYQETLMALHQERAKNLKSPDQQEVINNLLRQKGELQEHVRRLKQKMTGADPGYTADPDEDFSRFLRRKSFAPARIVSQSMNRLSMSLSIDQPERSGRVSSIRMPRFSLRRMAPPPVPPQSSKTRITQVGFLHEGAADTVNPVYETRKSERGAKLPPALPEI